MTPRASERWRRWDRMLVATRGGCPACGGPGAFRSLYALRPHCTHCGVRFERDAGSWLGAAVIAYAFAIAACALVAWWFVARAGGLGEGLEWWLVATGVATVLLVYRPVKGWWTWCMWAAGWVHRDGEDPERGA
jgi:uncharacterized protein (DUF983 family)